MLTAVSDTLSYGFDCGVNYASKSQFFTFINECIASDKEIDDGQISSKKVTSFSQQLKRLGLVNKKVFIKMDIEGAEYEAFDEIFEHSNNITGIAIEIHIDNLARTIKAVELLSALDKDFLLLHVHGNNYSRRYFGYFTTKNSIGNIPRNLELTYINKNLVTNYHLAKNQSHPTYMDMPNKASMKDAEFEILLK